MSPIPLTGGQHGRAVVLLASGTAVVGLLLASRVLLGGDADEALAVAPRHKASASAAGGVPEPSASSAPVSTGVSVHRDPFSTKGVPGLAQPPSASSPKPKPSPTSTGSGAAVWVIGPDNKPVLVSPGSSVPTSKASPSASASPTPTPEPVATLTLVTVSEDDSSAVVSVDGKRETVVPAATFGSGGYTLTRLEGGSCATVWVTSALKKVTSSTTPPSASPSATHRGGGTSGLPGVVDLCTGDRVSLPKA